MSRFIDYFSRRKALNWNSRVFLPVIHVKPGDEFKSGYQNVLVALEAGADGAFLIAHSSYTKHTILTRVVQNIREILVDRGTEFTLGVNYLDIAEIPDLPIYEAVRLSPIPMIWSDNPIGREKIEQARSKVGWDGIYFGAVAFKYQDFVSLEDLSEIAQGATWMDVLTTSGNATGQEIDLQKARVFAEAVPNSIRAVASGVSIDNIKAILPYFHAFLVSTSISSDFHHLCPKKTRKLADAIHNWSKID